MPDVTTIARFRSRRRKASRPWLVRIGLGCAGLVTLLVAVGGVFAAFQYSQATQNLPSIEILPSLLEPPNGLLLQPTRMYDRSGLHLLLELQNPEAPRNYLHLPGFAPEAAPQFSEALITATVAATDPGFYSHAGYSAAGLFSGEATTIAQHLVSDLLLAGEPLSLRRALRERLLAAQVTQRFGREKVLEWYLNSAAYGRLAYGAEAAARLYLGKSAADLNLAEAAVIAATALDPVANPIDDPQAALRAQKRLLLTLLDLRLVDPGAASGATLEKLEFRSGSHPGRAVQIADLNLRVDAAFIQLALDEVESRISRLRLERGGMNIYTTLDFALQAEASCTAGAQRQRLSGLQSDSRPVDCVTARLLPTLEIADQGSDVSTEVAILDPQSGQVLALVGDNTGSAGGELAAHPVGTLGTPFVYLTAFTRGLGPASLMWDIPASGATPTGDEYHGPVRLRIALANDYPRPANQILEQVGPENIWRTLQQFGISAPRNLSTDTPSALTLFRPLDLLEAGQVYAVLANGGSLAGHSRETGNGAPFPAVPPPIQPAAVLRIETQQPSTETFRRDWSDWQTRPIISPELAYMMTHVLSDETARWPSLGHPNPLELGMPAAAKLGTSAGGAWTIGYTTRRVVVAWVGHPISTSPDEPITSPEQSATYQSAAAGLYHAVMKTAHAGLVAERRSTPEGVSTVRVCDPSGMLPSVYCPNVIEEIFLAGNEPLQSDRLFRSVPVNRETGRLATVFTPPDLVDHRPYLIAPPEAADWAQAAGLETPPDVYDSLPIRQSVLPDVSLSEPTMFAVLSGRISLRGTAAGTNFSSYRIQIGKGLNPQEWIQVGEESTQPIRSGVLAEWDTSRLGGLYAVELQVVRSDNSVQRSVTLVTIDNQPPQVQIVFPVLHEEISLSAHPEIVILADVDDDLAVARIEMYIDGRLLGSFDQPPYAISWAGLPGTHTLRVVAHDSAGNHTEASNTFSVIEP